MLRVAIATAIVAFIYVHSPERPGVSPADEVARWLDRTKASVAEEAFRSGAIQEILRRSVAPDDKPSARPKG